MLGYSQNKPETRSRKRLPWSAGVPVNRAGGLPRGWSRASENPKLSAERPGQRLQRTGSPSGGQTRRRGRARASTHGEAGPLWVSCLSWPYPQITRRVAVTQTSPMRPPQAISLPTGRPSKVRKSSVQGSMDQKRKKDVSNSKDGAAKANIAPARPRRDSAASGGDLPGGGPRRQALVLQQRPEMLSGVAA